MWRGSHPGMESQCSRLRSSSSPLSARYGEEEGEGGVISGHEMEWERVLIDDEWM